MTTRVEFITTTITHCAAQAAAARKRGDTKSARKWADLAAYWRRRLARAA